MYKLNRLRCVKSGNPSVHTKGMMSLKLDFATNAQSVWRLDAHGSATKTSRVANLSALKNISQPECFINDCKPDNHVRAGIL